MNNLHCYLTKIKILTKLYSFLFLFIFFPFVLSAQIPPYVPINNLFVKAVNTNDFTALEKLIKEKPDEISVLLEGNVNLLFYAKTKKMIDFLVDKGLDINQKDRNGWTPLHYAQSLEVVKALVENRADLEIKSDYTSETPLLALALSMKKEDKVIEYLIEKGANLNQKSNDGNGLLHRLAQRYDDIDEQLLDKLLQKGLDLDGENNFGETPLSYAIARKTTAALLLKKGANPNKKNNYGFSPYLNNVNPEIAKLMIETGKVDINIRNNDNEILWLSWLKNSYSNQQENIELVELFVKKGVDLQVKDLEEKTPLVLALERQKIPFQLIDLLLERSADVNGLGKNGANLLHLALKNPDVNLALIKKLVEKGLDINSKDKLENTPFLLSLIQNKPEITTFLIDKKANFNIKNNQNKTALHYVRNITTADFLLKKGLDINAKNKEGNTPLMTALMDNNMEIARFFIDNKADVNTQNNQGNTPLHLVTNTEMAEILLKQKANINTKNNQGNTALHFADNVAISKLFIEKGANIHLNNNDGNTPLMMALIEQQREIAQFLAEKGAKDVENNNGMSASKLAKENKYEMIYFMLKGDKVYQKYLQTLPLWEAIYVDDPIKAKEALNKGADSTFINIQDKNMTQMLKESYFKNFEHFLTGKNTYPTLITTQRIEYPTKIEFLDNSNFIIVKNYRSFILIDTKTRKTIREFYAYSSANDNAEIKLSTDRKYLIQKDKKWDINTGKLVKNYQEALDEIEEDSNQENQFDRIATNNKYAMNGSPAQEMGSGDGYAAEVFDYKSKKLLFEIEEKTGFLSHSAFSHQDNYIIIGTDYQVNIWDIQQQKKIIEIENDKQLIGQVVMSNDEKYIAYNKLGKDKKHTIEIYEIATKKIIKSIQKGEVQDELLFGLHFSKDSEWLVTLTPNEGIVTIIDWKNEKIIASFQIEGHHEYNNANFLMDIDKKNLLIQRSNTLNLYDIASKKLLEVIETKSKDLAKVLYSENLEYIVIKDEKEVILQNIANGTNIFIPSKTSRSHNVLHHVFSPNLQQILLFPNDKTAELWDIERRKKIKVFSNIIGDFNDMVRFSKDGKYILAQKNYNKEFTIWDVNKPQKPVAMLKTDVIYGGVFVLDVAMSEDMKTIVINVSQKTDAKEKEMIIWRPFETKSEEITKGFAGMLSAIQRIAISKRNKYMIGFGSEQVPNNLRMKGGDEDEISETKYLAQVWDFKTQKLLYSLPNDNVVNDAFFTTDEKKLITISDNTIKIWDASVGELIRTISVNESIEKSTFSSLKNQLILKLRNNTIKIIDLETSKDILNIYSTTQHLFFVTNEGYYMPINIDIDNSSQKVNYFGDVNPSVESPFYFVNGIKIFTNEQFELQFNQPSKILERLTQKNQTIINSYQRLYEERLKNYGFKLSDLEKERFFNTPEINLKNINTPFQTTKESNYSLEIEAFDKVYDLHSLHISLNNKLIFGTKGKILSSKKINEFLKLNLQKGKNTIQIYVINQKSIKSRVENLEIELE